MSWIFTNQGDKRGIHLNICKSSMKSCKAMKGRHNGIGSYLRFSGLTIPRTAIHRIIYHNNYAYFPVQQTAEQAQESSRFHVFPHDLAHINLITPAIIVSSDIFKFFWWPAGLLGFMSSPVFSCRSPLLQTREEYKQALQNMENHEYGPALDRLNALLDMKPDLTALNPDRAICFYHMGNYEEAFSCMEDYIESNSKDVGGLLFYALLLLETRSYDRAAQLLTSLPRDKQENIEVINLMAYFFLEMDQPESALAALEKGPLRKRKLDESNLLFFNYLLGVTYLRLEQKEKAVPRLQKVYARDPDFMDTADLLLQSGDTRE